MDNFEWKITVDPKDKYNKAKKDIHQAQKSFNDLDYAQQQQLVYELIGAEKLNWLINSIQQLQK